MRRNQKEQIPPSKTRPLRKQVKVKTHRRDMREDIIWNEEIPEIPRKPFRKDQNEHE